MEKVTLTIPLTEVDAINQALEAWPITQEPRQGMAYDSITPYEFAHYVFDLATNKYSTECFTAFLGYYFGRNKNKVLKVKTKSGTSYEIRGFNADEVMEIMRNIKEIEITDDAPKN